MDTDTGQTKVPAWTRYTRLRVIGAGGFGQVFLAKGNPDAGGLDGEYVVKRMYLQHDRAEDLLRSAAMEIKVLQLLQHPNIVRYYEHFTDDEDYINIVMEYCPLGDLDKYIEARRKAQQPLKVKDVLFISFQILAAVRHLHENGILHRDLKPANIFLTQVSPDVSSVDDGVESLQVKIADFGISKVMTTGSFAHTVIGTPHYLAPEICESEPYSNSADIWSLGCIVYELAALERCFSGDNLLAVVRKISSGKVPPLAPPYDVVMPLVQGLIVVDPKKRLTAREAIERFFQPEEGDEEYPEDFEDPEEPE
jgi:serine/threonine protein kinase